MLERLVSGQEGHERLAHETRGTVHGQDNLEGQQKQGTWEIHIDWSSSSGFEMLSAQLELGSCLWREKGNQGTGAGAAQMKGFLIERRKWGKSLLMGGNPSMGPEGLPSPVSLQD